MRLSDFTLEQYLLRELPEKRMRDVKAWLESNPREMSRLDFLKESDRRILDEYSPEHMAHVIRQRHEMENRKKSQAPKGSWTAGLLLKRAALPVSALVLLIPAILYLPGLFTGGEPATRQIAETRQMADTTRLKGDSGLFIYRSEAAGPKRLKQDSRVTAGDLLQISFLSTADPHVAVFSIDARGSVTLHYPGNEKASTKVKPGARVLAPRSFELDDTPGFERFFMVSSKSSFSVKKVLEAAKALSGGNLLKGNIPLPEGFNQSSVTLLKVKTR
jgi:hypothetical protein